MKQIVKRLLNAAGLDLVRYRGTEAISHGPLTDAEQAIISRVRPYTMTSGAKLLALIDSIRYITRNRIPGDFVECGVWRGGSMMAAALVLLAESDTSRTLYLYDTFEGMSQPTAVDRSLDGLSAASQLHSARRGTGVWCEASLEDVRANLASTGYPADKIVYVPGKVEETIPYVAPEQIALLRLDTDWYESTRHELEYLHPRLTVNGILLLDDYGHWLGARKAADEFFESNGHSPLLQRIDYSGRLVIKTQAAAGELVRRVDGPLMRKAS